MKSQIYLAEQGKVPSLIPSLISSARKYLGYLHCLCPLRFVFLNCVVAAVYIPNY
jgi:hypothetical protein